MLAVRVKNIALRGKSGCRGHAPTEVELLSRSPAVTLGREGSLWSETLPSSPHPLHLQV